jgi:hypothetical protein
MQNQEASFLNVIVERDASPVDDAPGSIGDLTLTVTSYMLVSGHDCVNA